MSRSDLTSKVRQLLRKHRDLTVQEIMHLLNHPHETPVRRCLRRMPDTYVKEYRPPAFVEGRHFGSGRLLAVWSIVIPPPDAKYPKK